MSDGGPMIFLGIDPGLLVTGWALVEGRKCLDSGDIKAPKQIGGDLIDMLEDTIAEEIDHIVTGMELAGQLRKPVLSVERYTYQGKARASNPAGYEVAELSGSIATRARCDGFEVIRMSRNEILRCFSTRGKTPSEAEANAMLYFLLGDGLSNQHKRDAAMAAIAAQRRWRDDLRL